MRATRRQAWNPEWAGFWSVDVAQGRLGRYCMACERALPQSAVPWNAATDALASPHASAAEWPDLLVLCDNCAAAAALDPGRRVLRPDRDLTFTLGERSPLTYERRTVAVRPIDAPAPTAEVECVLVFPHSQLAADTVRHYGLNTALYDAVRDELVLHDGMDLETAQLDDRRLDLRALAWRDAEFVVRQLTDVPDDVRSGLIRSSRDLASNRGFWSVWATVLSSGLDRELVLELLQPPEEHRAAGLAAPHEPAHGAPAVDVHVHPFPGTRRDWLPPTIHGHTR